MKKNIFLSLIPMLTISLFLGLPSQASAAKKNVCSITINSSDEIEQFKKHLNPNDWNFIELTDFAAHPEDNLWLQKSCQKKIKCDILVVSGHFGGSFFGQKPLRLAVDELETMSCNNDCSGILNEPKEVFLFGCNTLASKDRDSRTPEEYLQVLLADGFNYAQASQIVSFRYSNFGDSFKDKMTQIFASTPRIYGFKSIGPSGRTVRPYLNKYLTTQKEAYDNFDAYNEKQGVKPNSIFLEALKKTSVVQAAGAFPNMKAVEEKPYCYIRSPKVAHINKLNYIDKVLSTDQGLRIITHIQNYLHTLKSSWSTLTSQEQAAFKKLSQNKKVKEDLTGLLRLQGDVYIPLKVSVINALKDLNILDQAAANEAVNKIVDLKTPFTETRQNLICSSPFFINLTVDNVPAERWKESPFIVTILCLRPQDPKILDKLVENLTPTSDALLKANSIWALHRLNSKNELHYLAIAKTLDQAKSDYAVKFAVAMTLKDLRPINPETLRIIHRHLIQETNPHIAIFYREILKGRSY